MENKVITIRSVYKVKEYHFQPTKQKNGLNWPWVKPTRIGLDGRSEMVLSDAERNDPNHIYFIPEDLDVIDTDGTRYIMASPETVTFHAGWSYLNGKTGCNYFTIGIEFQGNTLEKPLTEDQINSAIEYLLPLIAKYKISVNSIVTHEMVRNAYKKMYPKKRCSGKVDITQAEYRRFMKALKLKLNTKGK